MREHPERAFMREIVTGRRRGVPVPTNPLAAAVAMTIVAAEEGRVEASFEVSEQFTQGNGVVQGGIVSALLDFGMAFAAFSALPAEKTVASVSQTTNFFRAARAGCFVVDARLERVGRTLINARAELRDAENRLVATATAPFAVLPLP